MCDVLKESLKVNCEDMGQAKRTWSFFSKYQYLIQLSEFYMKKFGIEIIVSKGDISSNVVILIDTMNNLSLYNNIRKVLPNNISIEDIYTTGYYKENTKSEAVAKQYLQYEINCIKPGVILNFTDKKIDTIVPSTNIINIDLDNFNKRIELDKYDLSDDKLEEIRSEKPEEYFKYVEKRNDLIPIKRKIYEEVSLIKRYYK